MTTYIAKRLLATLPVMGMVALIVFAILRLTPGDPAAILAGDMATPQQLADIRQSMGLNEPLYVQFLVWVAHLVKGGTGDHADGRLDA